MVGIFSVGVDVGLRWARADQDSLEFVKLQIYLRTRFPEQAQLIYRYEDLDRGGSGVFSTYILLASAPILIESFGIGAEKTQSRSRAGAEIRRAGIEQLVGKIGELTSSDILSHGWTNCSGEWGAFQITTRDGVYVNLSRYEPLNPPKGC
jgi:hypothetical protein